MASNPPKDVAQAFAEWRLANPGKAGWPLDAFKAGWEAREPPPLRLLAKLGSIAVHAEEFFSADAHDFDRVALLTLLEDSEVKEWIAKNAVLLPRKRGYV